MQIHTKGKWMKSILYRLSIWILLMVIWLLLVSPLNTQEIISGAMIALLAALIPLPDRDVFRELLLTPKKAVYALLFTLVFLWEVVKSNLDVALRVIKPVIPINPGIVKVRTSLSSRMGRLALANAITLTPGTITVDIEGEYLYIHWISVEAGDIDEATKKIVSTFERYLEVIFG